MGEFFDFGGIIPNFLDLVPFWLNLVLRVVIAGFCGFIIGFERKTRSKEAGIRTHTILAIGAALFMIVSKYSFSDLVRVVYEGGQPTYQYYMGMSSTDASRVVAQAVTGIGFLGGGVIVYTKGSLHGLTTAAGIWATAGVGMMVGSGVGTLMVLGVITAFLIVGVHLVFRLPIKAFRTKSYHTVKIEFNVSDGAIDKIKSMFVTHKIANMKIEKKDGTLLGQVSIRTADDIEDEAWKSTVENAEFIRSIEYSEEEI